MDFKNQKDHWAFLEEIEAPMWVDLTSETKLNSQDIDDKWFQTSHLFHQYPSSQLKLAFSCSGEEGVTIEFDLAGASSPALPRSVSRSRGKDFKSKKWKGNCHDVSSNKIVSTKVSKGKPSESGEGIKPKHSFINPKGTSRSKTVSEITESAKGKNVKIVSTRGGPKRSSSPVTDKSGETNTKSTVTSECIQQQLQLKSFEVSSQGFSQTSELITSVKISLRKSRISRPPSRVEINADRSHGMESRDSKSSSGKSSVGSSSYSGYEAKRSTVSWIKRKELTPDSRNEARMINTTKNKVKPSDLCSKSNVAKEGNRNSRTGGLVTVRKKTWEEAIKSKANSQTTRSKLSLLNQLNEQKPVSGATKAREKVEVGKKVAGSGKENNTGEINLSQKCSGKGKAAEGMVVGRKGTTQSTSVKGGKTGSVVPKGRVGNQREGKNSTNTIVKVHFR